MLAAIFPAALLMQPILAPSTDAPIIDEQLECVLSDYSDKQKRALDKWKDEFSYGANNGKPVYFEVSLERAKTCKALYSWTDSQETMAAFHGTFVIEEEAIAKSLPKAVINVKTFYGSLNKEEAIAVDRMLVSITSGLVNAAGDEAEPSFSVLMAQYALDKKLTEKLPKASDDEKADTANLLLIGATKDITRKVFEREFETEAAPQSSGQTDIPPSLPSRSGPPPSSPPPSRSETIPTPPTPNN